MGASGWQYFVPFDPDVGRALRGLQDEVFRSKRYRDPRDLFFRFTDPADKARQLEQLLLRWPEAHRAPLRASIEERMRLPEPRSIDELVELAAESGTHSILDIQRVAKRSAAFATAPLTPKQLLALFDTETPDHATVEANALAVMDLRKRWHASHLVVFDEGAPTELFFTGFSGD